MFYHQLMRDNQQTRWLQSLACFFTCFHGVVDNFANVALPDVETQNDQFTLAWCRIYASWKTAPIFLVTYASQIPLFLLAQGDDQIIIIRLIKEISHILSALCEFQQTPR